MGTSICAAFSSANKCEMALLLRGSGTCVPGGLTKHLLLALPPSPNTYPQPSQGRLYPWLFLLTLGSQSLGGDGAVCAACAMVK